MLNALFCPVASQDRETEKLLLNTAPGDLPRSFHTAQHSVHKRAAVVMLLVKSCWPSCLAGITKKKKPFWENIAFL